MSAPILIVDDNPSNTKLMSFLLDRRGYDVRTAANADEALGTLTDFFPRLILMDLQMPGVDGFELTRRLKADERYRDVVIIAVTAYAMKGDERRALEAGCDGYITKPVDTRAFPALVEGWLST
ncbi:MAG TPA: response regulator [Polyangiaceae bacterium]|nr:response regulator [Polyangiaceae bacterium]